MIERKKLIIITIAPKNLNKDEIKKEK